MTESQTPSVLLPVGRDAGPRYDGAPVPTYRVLLGDQSHALSETEYAVWRLAHGVPDHVGLWKPSDTIEAAGAQGIRDAVAVIDKLAALNLLHEMRVMSEDALNFAVAYRPVPLVYGMTTRVDATERYGVATRDRVLAQTNGLVYQIFVWAALFDDLWSNCERLSRQAAAGVIALDDNWSAPEMIAELFLTECHGLLAVQALCFDLDPGIVKRAQTPVEVAS